GLDKFKVVTRVRYSFRAICVLLVLLTTYGSAALGQLILFHVVLIRKGMRTFDYIMAIKEENPLMEEDMSEDYLDFSSDETLDLDSPEKTRFSICRIDKAPKSTKKLCGFRADVSLWKPFKMSRQKAQLAAESGPFNIGVTPLVVKGMVSSPRIWFYVSPSKKQKYKSRQVLCSVIKKGDNESSPSPRKPRLLSLKVVFMGTVMCLDSGSHI
ncbi:hypothetical protein Tco_1481357, partial [Tanacetum coccineum]